jgi:hypothetical protein
MVSEFFPFTRLGAFTAINTQTFGTDAACSVFGSVTSVSNYANVCLARANQPNCLLLQHQLQMVLLNTASCGGGGLRMRTLCLLLATLHHN